MKLFSLSTVIFVTLLSSCGISAPEAARIHQNQGTVNDLPEPVLRCVEAVDGVALNDGRLEVSIYRDQFAQFSARVVQSDQFSGDTEIAFFLVLEQINKRDSSGKAEIVYKGNDEAARKTMTLSVVEVSPTAWAKKGLVTLELEGAQRIAELSCN